MDINMHKEAAKVTLLQSLRAMNIDPTTLGGFLKSAIEAHDSVCETACMDMFDDQGAREARLLMYTLLREQQLRA
jgi:hypothetical protein